MKHADIKRGDSVLYFTPKRTTIRKDKISYWNETDDGRRISARMETSYRYVKTTDILGPAIELTEG